jgi:hypothetical protein
VRIHVVVWLWHGVARVSEKHAAAPLRVGVTKEQYVPQKRRLPTTLHGVTSLKTTNEFTQAFLFYSRYVCGTIPATSVTHCLANLFGSVCILSI